MEDKLNLTPAALTALAKGDFENAVVAATPGGIEAQERAGQVALVASQQMPVEMHPSREAFEGVGFTFGEPVDELFLAATLPAGWARVATDHAMHSDIVDGKGRKRVSVFYKAAFYDRRASARMETRYWLRTDYHEGDENRCSVMDVEAAIHEFPPVKWRDNDAVRQHENTTRAWLLERYPNADDPTAYWD